MNTKEKIEFLKFHIDEFVKKGFRIKQGSIHLYNNCACPLGAVIHNLNLDGYKPIRDKYNLDNLFFESFDSYADRFFFFDMEPIDPKSNDNRQVAFEIFQYCCEKNYFVELK